MVEIKTVAVKFKHFSFRQIADNDILRLHRDHPFDFFNQLKLKKIVETVDFFRFEMSIKTFFILSGKRRRKKCLLNHEIKNGVVFQQNRQSAEQTFACKRIVCRIVYDNIETLRPELRAVVVHQIEQSRLHRNRKRSISRHRIVFNVFER